MIRFTEDCPFVAIEYSYEVDKVLYKKKSKFQDIMVFENPYFGNVMTLDGVVQVTERDEFFYHEMLTHPVMHAHPDPRTVVVVGGGDGGTVREVLKHKSVEKCYFIEIDPDVIAVSKEFFPTISSAIDDKRVEIRNMDGAEFIKSRKGDIDAVIVDSTDPIGFARTLFGDIFFKAITEALSPEGMFVTHSDSLLLHSDIVHEVQQSMRKFFPVVDLYMGPTATYPGNWWAYNVGSMKLSPREMRRPFESETKFYSDEMHERSFLPEKFYQRVVDGKLNW